jgi:hypothetical protein
VFKRKSPFAQGDFLFLYPDRVQWIKYPLNELEKNDIIVSIEGEEI